MSRKRASLAATATAVLTAAMVLTVAYWALPPGEWAYVDRPFDPDIPAQVGPPISEELPFELRVGVPQTGLARIDLRFAVSDGSPVAAEAMPQGAVIKFRLENDSGAQLWESLLSLGELSPDGTALVFPEIMPGEASAVRLSVQPEGLGPRTKVALWEVPCDCSDLISGHRQATPGGRFVSTGADPDATVYSRVVGRTDRIRLALHRLDEIHPTGFGKWAVLAWASLALVSALALTWYLSLLLFRTEIPNFRAHARTHGSSGEGDLSATGPGLDVPSGDPPMQHVGERASAERERRSQ